MFFASDNSSGVAPEILTALAAANQGYVPSYGSDPLTAQVTDKVRALFEAPEAAVYLVATGTTANALALATLSPPWSAIFCHQHAHIAEDECGAPEFFTHGAKLTLVPGAHGKIAPEGLRQVIGATGTGGVHGVQRGAVSITNVTEAGTVYAAHEIAALSQVAQEFALPVHLDGSRFANALVATGANPAEMSWKAGVDVLSFGGTKNGCMGVEAVVIFDPARAWEFELRRKRAGHLFSKQRYLAAQFDAYLANGLWLRLAARANQSATRLAQGLAQIDGVRQTHAVEANLMFPTWAAGTNARLEAAGAMFYGSTAPDFREGARLVTSWSTSDADVDRFLSLF